MKAAPTSASNGGVTRYLIIGAVVTAILGATAWFMRPAGPKLPNGAGETASASTAAAESMHAASGAQAQPQTTARAPGGAPVLDRERADRIRAQLRAALLAPGAADPQAAAQPARQYAQMPGPREGDPPGDVSVSYIRGVMRDEYIPLAKQCYENLLAKDPKRGGVVSAMFVIVGDAKTGGVVESVELKEDAKSIQDPEFRTCMRESLMSVVFDAPPNGGKLTVGYPLTLSPDDDPDAPDAAPPADAARRAK